MLTGKEVDNAICNVFGYLDTINLMPYITQYKGKDIRDLMSKLELEFPYTDKYSETLFDAIAQEEFMDYLNEKYNLKLREITISHTYINI